MSVLSFRITRSARASWQGTVSEGSGQIALGSGAFAGSYSLRARIEEGERATNPEELVGAAEAACFTMSFASLLDEAGLVVRDLTTTARVTLAQVGDAYNITRIELSTVGDVPGLTRRPSASWRSGRRTARSGAPWPARKSRSRRAWPVTEQARAPGAAAAADDHNCRRGRAEAGGG